MRQTVVGVFERYAGARHAAQILEDSGFDHDHVHVTGAEERSGKVNVERREEEGFLSGIRNFFADIFGPDETQEVGTYAEAVRRGGGVVKVDVDEESELERARETLQQAGAVDIDEKVEEWRASGWAPEAREPQARPEQATAGSTRPTAEGVIPVVKEELAVGKRAVSTGGVRVYSHVIERPVEEAVDLRTERAQVQRQPVDRPATQADLANMQDKTLEVRETTEQPVVQKSARVVEEVSVGKSVQTRQEKIKDKVRDTEVKVEKVGETQARRSFEDYDADFRQDFDARYAASGDRYDQYQPAYRYGYDLASDRRYAGRQWDDIETDARRDWEASHAGSAWERFKASVRHAWERVTGED